MKDLIKVLRKALLVTKQMLASIILLTCFLSCSGSKSIDSGIDPEGYDVINDLWGTSKRPIYYKTVEEPSWDHIMSYDSIFKRTTGPIKITDEELKNRLSHEDLNQIKLKIRSSRTTLLDPDLISVNSLSRKRSKSIVLSSPVIIGNIALLRIIGEEEIPIFILEKDKETGTWVIQYMFFQKLVLE